MLPFYFAGFFFKDFALTGQHFLNLIGQNTMLPCKFLNYGIKLYYITDNKHFLLPNDLQFANFERRLCCFVPSLAIKKGAPYVSRHTLKLSF